MVVVMLRLATTCGSIPGSVGGKRGLGFGTTSRPRFTMFVVPPPPGVISAQLTRGSTAIAGLAPVLNEVSVPPIVVRTQGGVAHGGFNCGFGGMRSRMVAMFVDW